MPDDWSIDRIVDDTYRTKFIDVPKVIADWLGEHGGLAGRDVLDFGCGEATTALGIALQHGARRVVGIEIHEEVDNALPFAKAQLGLQRLPDNLELVRLGADSSLEELGTFDVIYSWSVFEHVGQDMIADCFAKMRRVLRPNGVMFLQTTPLFYSAEGSHLKPWVPMPWAHLVMQQDLFYLALRERVDNKNQADHLLWVYETLNRVTAPQLLRAVVQAGFEVVREYKTYDNISIPAELRDVYTQDALTTNQLVFLAKHALPDPCGIAEQGGAQSASNGDGQARSDTQVSDRLRSRLEGEEALDSQQQSEAAMILCQRVRKPPSSNVTEGQHVAISSPGKLAPTGAASQVLLQLDDLKQRSEALRVSFEQLKDGLDRTHADIAKLDRTIGAKGASSSWRIAELLRSVWSDLKEGSVGNIQDLVSAKAKARASEPVRDQNFNLIDVLEVIAATLAVTVVLATLVWEASHYFPSPIHDDIFDRLRMYRALADFPAFMKYLVSGHNEHRILTTRIVAFVDEFVFSGREYTQVIVTNALQLVTGYLIYRLVFRSEIGSVWGASERFFALSTILLFFINPNLLYTLIVPFQVQHAIMAFLCVAAACLVSREASSPETCTLRSLLPGLLLLAIVGTFTLGNAPAIFIAATVTALVARLRPRLVLTLAVLSILHTAIVLATTEPVGVSQNDPVQILKFALVYWGAPFLRFTPWPAPFATWSSSTYLAAAFGACVPGAAAIFGFLRIVRPGAGGRAGVFGFTLSTIVMTTGVAAAHSRAQFGLLEAASKKYASFAALGWVAVLAILCGFAYQRWGLSRRSGMGIFAGMVALQLPLAASGYGRETRLWDKLSDRVWESGLAAFLQINDRSQLMGMYTDENQLKEYLGYVTPSRRGIFSYFPFNWGDNATEFISRRQTTNCRSEVETLSPIPASDLTAIFQVPGIPVRIAGWAWMNEDRQPPSTIFVVDSKDHIVGAARTIRSSSRAEEWLGQKVPWDLGWFGFARLTEPQPVKFFALSRDGRQVCSLGGVGDTR